MNHLLSVAVSLLLFLFSPLSFAQQISVKMETPAEVKAGDEFQVNMLIDKGKLQSFSRFTQILPFGLTAERIATSNADFSFEDQRLRIIWLKLPENSTIPVRYKIKVDPRLTGSFELKGEFAYVDNNERKLLPVSPGHLIKILPNAGIAENQRVDIKDFQEIALRNKANVPDMEVIRNAPVKIGNNEYSIELIVKNNSAGRFAKIEEYIPSGYKVLEGESLGGIFSLTGKVMKILWTDLPQSKEFIVSYRVIPEPGHNIEKYYLNGSYSYIKGNETKSFAIKEQIDALAEFPVNQNVETDYTRQETTSPQVEDHSSTEKKPIQLKPANEFRSYVNGESRGVYFKVQVAAGHGEINIKDHFLKLRLRDDVSMEYHDGWRKYTVGPFRDYNDAILYREMITEHTLIKDAFLAAYNNGKRITIQEALMVIRQNNTN